MQKILLVLSIVIINALYIFMCKGKAGLRDGRILRQNQSTKQERKATRNKKGGFFVCLDQLKKQDINKYISCLSGGGEHAIYKGENYQNIEKEVVCESNQKHEVRVYFIYFITNLYKLMEK